MPSSRAREREKGGKICTLEAARTAVSGRGKRRLAFTNGCFDLFHPGHLALLEFARKQADVLAVGINSDESVARLKGEGRPVFPLAFRAFVLSLFNEVDLVVPFEEDTPLSLILALRPDVLVKGADYAASEVVGGEEVLSWGGRVALAPLVEGWSSSKLLRRAR